MKKYFSLTMIILLFILVPQQSLAKEDTNIQVIKNSDKDFNILNEKYQILKDENGRLRIEIRDLKGKINGKDAKNIPVLMYHHILKQADIDRYNQNSNTSVLSLETFEEQMKYLYDNNFYAATVEELELFLNNKLDLPEKTVVITFDDGYLSNAKYAYPILQKYNFKATIFMIGYRVDGPQLAFDPSSTQALSISETTRYTDVFDYESHTYNMHDFKPGTTNPLLLSSSEDEVKRDLLKNKTLVNARYLAYPYGRYNDTTIRLAKETGHRLGFTINKGYSSKNGDKFRIPRNNISQKATMEQFMNLVNGISVIN